MKLKKTKSTQAAPRRPGPRGWDGPGSGRDAFTPFVPSWRGTSVQVCGLWPFVAGSGVPHIGVPLGRHIAAGASAGTTVCCDPVSWFERGHLISNPSVFVMGNPGIGKSTVLRRMAVGLAGFGTLPLILGDTKPDFVDLVGALDGNVLRFGRGRGHLNVLDPGASLAARDRLSGRAREELDADIHGRQFQLTSALIEIMRHGPIRDREETILSRAITLLNEQDGIPTLHDLLALLRQAPQEVRDAALDRGDMDRYGQITEELEASLLALTGSGRLGSTFAEQTDVDIDITKPLVIDISGIQESDHDLQAAVLLSCWTHGFAAVETAQLLADEGLEPRRHFFIIMDELWRVLRSSSGMVDRVDAITRLNRNIGVGQAMATHTMSDLEALPSEVDRAKARGFVERSGMLICGGLSFDEVTKLRRVMEISDAEANVLNSWQAPPSWDSSGKENPPPGRGKFLIKVGGRPGIPLKVMLTQSEIGINDTNKRWAVE